MKSFGSKPFWKLGNKRLMQCHIWDLYVHDYVWWNFNSIDLPSKAIDEDEEEVMIIPL
jgi:hypothetical protein